MRLHRLIAILLLLESRGQLKARELACALEVTERTVHRDIATLCEAGVPIVAIAGPSGGFRLMEGYTKHLPQLHQNEAAGLFDVRAAQKRFYFDPAPWWESVPVSMHLDVLRQGVWHSRKVEIDYENLQANRSRRAVRPYGLVVKSMQWYLVGYCELRDEIRTFSVSRILEVGLLDDAFTWPDDFSLESYWKARAREFRAEVVQRERP